MKYLSVAGDFKGAEVQATNNAWKNYEAATYYLCQMEAREQQDGDGFLHRASLVHLVIPRIVQQRGSSFGKPFVLRLKLVSMG